MTRTHFGLFAGGSRRILFFTALAAAIAIVPMTARSEVRPLVREMLENLASLNEIGEAVALEDFERAKSAAADLEARAGALLEFDIALLGVDPKRDGDFDGYLKAQQRTARAIVEAAEGQDGAVVFRGVQSLLDEACVGCHRNFRDRENLMRPSAMFMSTLLNSWKDLNRGLMTNDFDLVARRAHDIQAVGRVFTWDQVIQSTFGIQDPEERSEFRAFLSRLTAQARQVERAADEQDPAAVVEATRLLWTQGCLACHEQFRSGD